MSEYSTIVGLNEEEELNGDKKGTEPILDDSAIIQEIKA